MISKRHAKEYCKEDISFIENYEVAVADTTQTWECHHRAEILPCGIYSQEDLKKFGLFEAQPANRLIFLSVSEHALLHSQHRSDVTRQKISESLHGNTNKRGKRHSEVAKQKMSEAHLGKHQSDVAKEKIREARRGKHLSKETRQKLREANGGENHPMYGKLGILFWNNGKVSVRARECPGPEWKRGRLQNKKKQPHVEGETLVI